MKIVTGTVPTVDSKKALLKNKNTLFYYLNFDLY